MTVPTQPAGGAEPMPQRIDQVLAEIQELKVTIAPFVAKISDHDDDLKDHETRIRVVERIVPDNLQAQLATLQARKYVPPAALAWAIGTAIACLGLLITFLSMKG